MFFDEDDEEKEEGAFRSAISEITECCCCIRHDVGVLILGFIQFGVIAVSGVSFIYFYGNPPLIAVEVSLRSCRPRQNSFTEGLQKENRFLTELSCLAEYLKDLKPSEDLAFASILCVHVFALIITVLLLYGVMTPGHRGCIIFWLLSTQAFVIILILSGIYIIYLETRLFELGTSIIGLFSILAFFLAGLYSYFYVVVYALLIRLTTKREVLEPRLASDIILGYENEVFDNSAHSINGRIHYSFEESSSLNQGNESSSIIFMEEIPLHNFEPSSSQYGKYG